MGVNRTANKMCALKACKNVLLLFSFSNICGFLLTPDSIVRQDTPVGVIFGRRGRISFDGMHKEMTIFRGIPYAEQPVRFEKPVTKAPFRKHFIATEFGPKCPQPYARAEDVSEDCLSLNIYLPLTQFNNATLPVMVWIHGGGFLHGSGREYDFERLSAFGDVMIVTLNYRLAQLGFLSTNNMYIPGNYGLWDQHLAIKWVKDNIGAFGGNGSQVTIFGESAGSASVMYQTVYPGNKGLFQRAIAESGSMTSLWSRKNRHEASTNAWDFAQKCGCNSHDDMDMKKCLTTVPISKVLQVMNGTRYSLVDNPWTPTVDGDFVVTDQLDIFTPTNRTADALAVYNSLQLLIGINRADGLVYLLEVATTLNQTVPENLTLTQDEFKTRIIPWFLSAYNNFTNVPKIAIDAVEFAYTDWSRPYDEIARLNNFVQYVTDIAFIVPTISALNARKASSPAAYLYELAHRPSHSYLPHITRIETDSSANHADDLLFVMDSTVKYQHTPQEQQLAHAIMAMWTKFAKSGNPNKPEDPRRYFPVTWPPYDSHTQRYLELSPRMSSLSVKQRLAADRMNMWLHLLPKVLEAAPSC